VYEYSVFWIFEGLSGKFFFLFNSLQITGNSEFMDFSSMRATAVFVWMEMVVFLLVFNLKGWFVVSVSFF
jgi:uncharacterized membrane protein